MAELCKFCHIAWQKGFMAGFSGNASLRLSFGFIITASGAAKGFMRDRDCLLLDAAGNALCGSSKPSSELATHLACYEAMPGCKAILHTHPTGLQALELKAGGLSGDKLFNAGLYEEQIWKERLFFAADKAPGSQELAEAAVRSLTGEVKLPCAIWLEKHGLVALGVNLRDCLCVTEELEHLAMARLMAG